jgi:DNA-binding PadR family transcriptional regulator
MPIRRVTTPLLLVVRELLRKPLDERWGYELSEATGLAPGTIQPILTRLESEGWLDVRWEDIDAMAEGRRPRRLYSLTGSGLHAAQALLDERAQQIEALRRWSGGAAPA